MQKVKVFAGFAAVHATLFLVGVATDGHAAADGLVGVDVSGEAECVDVVAEVEFVVEDGLVVGGWQWPLQRVFVVDGAGG